MKFFTGWSLRRSLGWSSKKPPSASDKNNEKGSTVVDNGRHAKTDVDDPSDLPASSTSLPRVVRSHSSRSTDGHKFTAELLSFLGKAFVDRAGRRDQKAVTFFSPKAYIIGLPLKEAITGIEVETCIKGQYDPASGRVAWTPYVYTEEEAREDERELRRRTDGQRSEENDYRTPTRSVDVDMGSMPLSSEETRQFSRIRDGLRKTVPGIIVNVW